MRAAAYIQLAPVILATIKQRGPTDAIELGEWIHEPRHHVVMMAVRRLIATDQLRYDRGARMIYVPGQESTVAEYRIPDPVSLEAEILASVSDGAWHDSIQLRRSMWHRGHSKAAAYAAIRKLITRGDLRKRFDGEDRGRRYSVWSVQACQASKAKPRPPERSGYRVVVRPRVVSAEDLRAG